MVAGIFLLGSTVYSGIRGFIKESFCVAGWIVGYLGAVYFHPSIAPFFKQFFKTAILVDLAAFFSIFAVLYIFIRLTGFFARRNLGLKHIPATVDHGAGAIMGVAKGAFFLAIFLSPLQLFPEMKDKLVTRSVAATMIIEVSQRITNLLGVELVKEQENLKKKLEGLSKTAKIKLDKQLEKANTELKETILDKNGKPVIKKVEIHTKKDREQMDKLIKSLK